jgi:hypothetical protein
LGLPNASALKSGRPRTAQITHLPRSVRYGASRCRLPTLVTARKPGRFCPCLVAAITFHRLFDRLPFSGSGKR